MDFDSVTRLSACPRSASPASATGLNTGRKVRAESKAAAKGESTLLGDLSLPAHVDESLSGVPLVAGGDRILPAVVVVNLEEDAAGSDGASFRGEIAGVLLAVIFLGAGARDAGTDDLAHAKEAGRICRAGTFSCSCSRMAGASGSR